jgi:hypothetical protein
VTCAVLAGGCGEDPVEVEVEPAYVIHLKPAPGATISLCHEITVVFNRDPGLVRSEQARLEPAGQTGAVRTFSAGYGSTKTFDWDRGSLSVDYSEAICDPEPPTLDNVVPDQGATATAEDVSGGIVLTFSRPVTPQERDGASTVKMTGPDGWEWVPSATIDGNSVKLAMPAAGTFQPGAMYVVSGTFVDKGGWETDIWLEYVIADTDGQGGAP